MHLGDGSECRCRPQCGNRSPNLGKGGPEQMTLAMGADGKALGADMEAVEAAMGKGR
jgi:hypothetical protein